MPDSTNTRLAVIASQLQRVQNDLADIRLDVKQIKQDNENHYVTKDEFEPVRRVVYGMVSLILVSVLGAIVALIIRQ